MQYRTEIAERSVDGEKDCSLEENFLEEIWR